MSVFFVIARIVANPLSNVFQKTLGLQADARFIIFVTHLLLAAACAPALLFLGWNRLGPAFWGNMILCAVLAVAGNTLIVASLKAADLSVLGPLNAYKSIVGLVLGIFLLGEYPSPMGILGVILILAGSLLILDQPPSTTTEAESKPITSFAGRVVLQASNRGVQLRFVALMLSAAEAVFLKKALLLSSPAVTFVFWCMLGVPLAGLLVLWALPGGLREQVECLRHQRMSYLLLTGTTGVMQFSTLYTFKFLQVGYSLALFQTSTLLSVLFGYRFFREGYLLRRLAGASVMVAGAVLIASG